MFTTHPCPRLSIREARGRQSRPGQAYRMEGCGDTALLAVRCLRARMLGKMGLGCVHCDAFRHLPQLVVVRTLPMPRCAWFCNSPALPPIQAILRGCPAPTDIFYFMKRNASIQLKKNMLKSSASSASIISAAATGSSCIN